MDSQTQTCCYNGGGRTKPDTAFSPSPLMKAPVSLRQQTGVTPFIVRDNRGVNINSMSPAEKEITMTCGRRGQKFSYLCPQTSHRSTHSQLDKGSDRPTKIAHLPRQEAHSPSQHHTKVSQDLTCPLSGLFRRPRKPVSLMLHTSPRTPHDVRPQQPRRQRYNLLHQIMPPPDVTSTLSHPVSPEARAQGEYYPVVDEGLAGGLWQVGVEIMALKAVTGELRQASKLRQASILQMACRK